MDVSSYEKKIGTQVAQKIAKGTECIERKSKIIMKKEQKTKDTKRACGVKK